MAVIAAGAFFVYLFLPNDANQDPVKPIDYQVEAATAARAAPYELLVPEGLSADWRPTSVRYQTSGDYGAAWRLGYVDPDNEYIGLAQTDGDEKQQADLIRRLTKGASETGETARVGGVEWVYYEGEEQHALVLTEPGVTTVVTGTVPRDGLELFAGSLEPHPAQE